MNDILQKLQSFDWPAIGPVQYITFLPTND